MIREESLRRAVLLMRSFETGESAEKQRGCSMKRIAWNAVIAVVVLLSTGPAFAQQGSPSGRWVNPGGGNHAHGNGMQGRPAGGRSVGAAPSGGTSAASPSSPGFRSRFGAAPVGSVTDPGFAGRLGRTVGRQPGAGAAGFGNINSPGGFPGIQPFPAGSGFPIPNINHPGGTPEMHRGIPRGNGRLSRRGAFGHAGNDPGPILYGVPYYVPVYPLAVPAPAVAQPRPYNIPNYRGLQPAFEDRAAVPPQTPRPVTLLAFKDSTVIAVTDYWLEGNLLVYETTSGVRTSAPLDRLDFALTQQLNFERNVPFILAARP